MDIVKKNGTGEKLFKVFLYLALSLMAILILVPVLWVFMASVKENSEFYGNPWAHARWAPLAELCGRLADGKNGRVHA